MKKLLAISAVILGLMSCTPTPTITEATNQTKLPMLIIRELGDTSLKLDATLIECGDQTYIIRRNIQDRQLFVSSVLDAKQDDTPTFIGGILIGALALLILTLFVGIINHD